MQHARAFQRSAAFAPYRQLRQVVEHRLARLMQLGMRQARYFGRTKTLFQLVLAATVANPTLIAARVGLMGDRSPPDHPRVYVSLVAMALLITSLVPVAGPIHTSPSLTPRHRGAFRPGF